MNGDGNEKVVQLFNNVISLSFYVYKCIAFIEYHSPPYNCQNLTCKTGIDLMSYQAYTFEN